MHPSGRASDDAMNDSRLNAYPSKRRMTPGALALLGALLLSAPVTVAQPCASGAPPAAVEGAWKGTWRSAGPGRGSAGLVISLEEGTGRAIAQVTFLVGATAHSGRYYATVCGDVVTVPLTGGGQLVLRLEERRLVGRFEGADPTLPARQGTVELSPG